VLNPKIEEKAPRLLFWGLISTFYALADINSNAKTSHERDLIRGGKPSAFSRLGPATADYLPPTAA
jgi:hypothetical protein